MDVWGIDLAYDDRVSHSQHGRRRSDIENRRHFQLGCILCTIRNRRNWIVDLRINVDSTVISINDCIIRFLLVSGSGSNYRQPSYKRYLRSGWNSHCFLGLGDRFHYIGFYRHTARVISVEAETQEGLRRGRREKPRIGFWRRQWQHRWTDSCQGRSR